MHFGPSKALVRGLVDAGVRFILIGGLPAELLQQLAAEAGHRGVFLTLTAPSRFHSSLRAGGKNPAYSGATPRDAQDWLCDKWAKARARLHRIGVGAYGFRIVEPHHDGCPHWHGILWAAPSQLWRLVLNIKRAWLKDGGDEPGALQHRCKALLMRGGEATGYVAKYIAKNIDDAHAVGDEGQKRPAKLERSAGLPSASRPGRLPGESASSSRWDSRPCRCGANFAVLMP